MIWKVLRTNIKINQLAAAFLGVFCGLSLLMISASFYINIKTVFTDKEGFWQEEFIVINKNIHFQDTYHQHRGISEGTNFSKKEIENIKSQSFVNDVAEFTTSTFSVRVFADRDSPIGGFYSDLFFESVPDKYIDLNTDEWYWEEGMNFVPIIIPRVYLNLYNFGFSQSQSLPQIPEDGVGIMEFSVWISGNNKSKQFDSRIIGFSDRINTFLVPQSFINWANKKYGAEKNPPPGRLIVLTNDPANPELIDFIEKNNYAVSKSLLNNAKALTFLRNITATVLTIGIIIISLAFWLMIVSIILLLERNKENISKLSLLGYSLKDILKPYKYLIIFLISGVFVSSTIVLGLFNNLYFSFIEAMSYEVPETGFWQIFVLTLILVIIAKVAIIFYIRKKISLMIK